MNKNLLFKSLMLLLITCITGFKLNAQVNLALSPSATATCSSPSAFFTPDKINNGIISQCEFQEFWFFASGTNTTDWITLTFSSFVDVNSIRMFLGFRQTRYISAATVQIWNGSAWVDHHSYSVPYTNSVTQPCDYIINFPRVNVDRIRLSRFTFSGGQTSNPSIREIQVFNLRGRDMATTSVLPIFGSGILPVNAFIRNVGLQNIDSVNIGWSVNGAAQTGFKIRNRRPALTFRDSQISVGSFNFIANTLYTVRVWTALPNNLVDSLISNDTFTYVFTAIGKPLPPVTTNQTYCGVSNPTLIAKGELGTVTSWSRMPSGIPSIASGDSVVLNTLLFPTSTNLYYARSLRSLSLSHTMAPRTGTWSFTGGAAPAIKGNYVNVFSKYNIIMDSVNVGISAPNAGAQGPLRFRLYYREGRHENVELDSFSWIYLGETIKRIPILPLYNLPIQLTSLDAYGAQLKANTQYAFYYEVENCDINVRTLANAGTFSSIWDTVFENEVLRVTEGALGAGSFGSGGMIRGFIPENHYFYRISLRSDSAIATIQVNPRPIGAMIRRGANSLGTHRAGVISNFDFVTNGEKIDYALAPPTGYTNANFGTNWVITDLQIRTASGTGINALDTVTSLPSTTDSGRISIIPRLSEVDSLYRITLTLRDLGPFNCDSTITRWLYVAPRPFANFSVNNSVCDGDNIVFNNTSTIQSGNMIYKWYFMTTTNIIIDSADAVNPVYKFPTFGTFRVRLIATNAAFGYSKDTVISITVGEIPTISVKVINACEGIPVMFNNNTTVSTSTPTYQWFFGDNNQSSATSPSHLYALPGGYQVKLVATAGGCFSEKIMNAYQFARPVTNFTLPAGNLCSNRPLKFLNNTTIAIGDAGAYWTFNDGNAISTEINPSHPFSAGNTYNIKLRSVSEFGCADSLTKPITIKLAPKAQYTFDKACEREATLFTNTSTDAGSGAGFVWLFSDATTTTIQNPTKNWNSVGSFTARLIATSLNTCADTIIKTINVLPQPIADFTVNSACSGQPVNFTNNSSVTVGNLNFAWVFGDGGTSNFAAPIYTYNVANSATYNVTLTANTPGGCPATKTQPINIEPSPLCAFVARDTFITGQGRGIWFSANVKTYPTYRWLLGDGSSSAQAQFFHKYEFDRIYNVVLNASNASNCNCSSDSFRIAYNAISVENIDKLNIKVYPNPAQNDVNITGENITSLKLYSNTGQLLQVIDNPSYANKLYIGNYAAGIYNLQVITEKGNATVKIIKYN